ncbi:MAG: hypothetical protein WED07_13500 [Candidatus Freyarchaeum deiterrae]
MTELNSLYNAIAFGTVLTALDKMGVNPSLVARQASRVLAPMMKELGKQISTQTDAKNLKEFISSWDKIMETAQFADPKGTEASVSNNTLYMKLTNCMFNDMANFGKSQGYPACPICIVNLMVISFIGAQGIGEVADSKVENKENVCKLKVSVD